jgi:RNA polymerase sigma-70 factor (ECF subfamily)
MGTDKILWDAMRAGDKSALETIYRSHVDSLYRYGLKIAQDPGLTEDAIQDLFIKLWNRRESLGPTDNIKNYLFTSLRRTIYRSRKSRSVSTDPQELKAQETAETFEDFLISEEISAENAQKLKKALLEISERQREVIYLRYYQNMDYDEICDVMGITYQGARNMLFKAVKNLKKHLFLPFLLLHIGYKGLINGYNG